MKINRFRLNILIRILFLAVSVFTLIYLLYILNIYYAVVILFLFVCYEVYSLFVYVDKTNRDLSRFLDSIKHSDFSQAYISKNFGESFEELYNSFRSLTNQMLETRSEKEQSLQYLQTIVKHVAIGLITYRKDGEVELINNAAKKLLNVESLHNIYNLGPLNRELLGILSSIKAGEKALVKIENKGIEKQISLFAAEFKLKDREFTLVSLQDIKSELERERLSNELEIAHQVQMRLLPKSCPEINGYSFAALCEPAKEVGGDYYDFINLGNNRTGVVIGDVAGKGLPAAIYMTLTKGIFHSYSEGNFSPKEVLTKINKLIYQIIESGSFITMFYGIIDCNNDEFIFARAGHEAALFFNTAGNNIKSLRPLGLGLGLEDGTLFAEKIEEQKIKLTKGDTILLYTDGVTDANNRLNEEYGINRLKEFIKENKINNSTSLLENIYQDVKNFSQGVNQFDDITGIIIKKI